MADGQNIEQAQSAVKGILDVLKIARVVCVDDEYDDEVPIEEVVSSACAIDRAVLRELLPELGDNIPDDLDVLREQVRRLWTDLDAPTRSDRAERILRAAPRQNDEEIDDIRYALILDDLIPKDILLTLSPKQWKERRDALLTEDSEQRTLFLFDQDLSKAGGDPEGGIKIIASLLARDDSENLICGLLTHTVSPAQQFSAWAELSEAHHIPRDRFLVVPKLHLREDPVLFAQTLKLVALSPDFAILKHKAKGIIEDAAASAASRVEAINIYDLDHMVFQVSADEGLWEPDMLFRLHTLFHRLESRRRAHEGGELEMIASRMRSVSDIPTKTQFMIASSTWEIQRSELYESAAYLNQNHLPLEVGDIFEKIGSNSRKRYVLLAPPCDLMIRKDGKRHPELVHVPVAEVVPTPDPPRHATEMEYFGENPNERWYVKLKQVHQVSVCLLDLCVFNDDGSATIRVDGEVPEMIRPAWKARYAILVRLFRGRLNRMNSLSPVVGETQDVTNVKARIRLELGSDLLNEGLFKGALLEQNGIRSIAYDCRRIGRLFGSRAFGLLMDYTACLSRPAYDRDFV